MPAVWSSERRAENPNTRQSRRRQRGLESSGGSGDTPGVTGEGNPAGHSSRPDGEATRSEDSHFRFIGDSAMAVVGAPTAGGDDAER
jgi:hypothetical protein